MKRLLKKIGLYDFALLSHRWLVQFGIDPLKFVSATQNLGIVLTEFSALKKQNQSTDKKWKINLSMPFFHDRNDLGGTASGHYFHQDLLVARRVFARKPQRHVDVGSRVDGFVAHVACFREIEVFDIRTPPDNLPNIIFRQADLMNLLPQFKDYCDSLSCLHALEHFGLGRYGDPVNIEGYVSGFEGLSQMLQSGGVFYLSVPTGTERIEFNGHRVFSIETILKLAESKFDLINFSYIDDAGDLHENVSLDSPAARENFNLNYGCGIFEFVKR